MTETPNHAAANAGERFQFRFAVHVSWPGVAEFLSLGRLCSGSYSDVYS